MIYSEFLRLIQNFYELFRIFTNYSELLRIIQNFYELFRIFTNYSEFLQLVQNFYELLFNISKIRFVVNQKIRNDFTFYYSLNKNEERSRTNAK